MNLIELDKNKKAKIINFSGGYSFRERLNSMGLNRGREIQRIDSNYYGPILLKVAGATFAIGRGMAYKIIVEEIEL